MSATSDYMLVHSVRMPLRWGDMDAMGHVNNTVYFRYLEQARIDLAGLELPVFEEGVDVAIRCHGSFSFPTE